MTADLSSALEGLGAEPFFEGPVESCPVCRRELDQLTLALELDAGAAPCCTACGAVLAA